jgi:preprotein translocase subunit SecA
MISSFLSTIFGTKDSRRIKEISKVVHKINYLESEISKLSDKDIQNKRDDFRARLISGETLEDILPEAFAVVREASKRVLGMRHFDVQLIGGIVLHQGKVSEMKTGEGKTLVATLAVYLNAISGKGVHVVTVNDYLAKRDKEWMEPLYNFLGLSVGVVINGLDFERRREAYRKDITYGTNNEFGFDYLRDNMSSSRDFQVQRELNFAIVDEVDSILIDEARTPLIISGSSKSTLDVYNTFSVIARTLVKDQDYEVHEKDHNVLMKEEGISKVERLLKIDNLYSPENVSLTHYLNQALKAKELYKKDVDYIIRDGKIIIVDEFTGRLMDGRRYSEGLHQSIESKENVDVASENFTLASITLQNYFRIYDKLSGMTGTAKTEEAELVQIYNLEVISIPTNRPVSRIDNSDLVFITKEAKMDSILSKILAVHEKGQPILVGTASISSSEIISKMLNKNRIPHNVLNAKNHEREAEIIAQAGRIKAITIATNMAGRGTDIVLGGNPEYLAKNLSNDENDPKYIKALEKFKEQSREERSKVLELGGLFVLGTERHESRRVDNQLRGRSGRQGDVGESQFYLSLDDDLMRLFGSDRTASLMMKMGYDPKTPIQHKLINRSIANAQKRVEARNFSSRKQLLEYDDVMNRQRKIIYSQRNEIIDSESLENKVQSVMNTVLESAKINFIKDNNKSSFIEYFKDKFDYDITENEDIYSEYNNKMKDVKNRLEIEKRVMLKVIDERWRDHLSDLDSLREGIYLQSYSQKDPIVEYKIASSNMYTNMAKTIREEIAIFLFRLKI